MNGGGGDAPPPSAAPTDGEFLLQLLQRPAQQPLTPSPPAPRPLPVSPSQMFPQDPAVAAVGHTVPFLPLFPPPTNGLDFRYQAPVPPGWPHQPPPPLAPHAFMLQGFPQNPNPSPNFGSPPSGHPQYNMQFSRGSFGEGVRKSGFSGANPMSAPVHHLEQNSLTFGSFDSLVLSNEGQLNGAFGENLVQRSKAGVLTKTALGSGDSNGNRDGLEIHSRNHADSDQKSRMNSSALSGRQQRKDASNSVEPGMSRQSGNFGTVAQSPRPPGFTSKSRNVGVNRHGNRRNSGGLDHKPVGSNERDSQLLPKNVKSHGNCSDDRSLSSQLDSPGPPAGSHLHFVANIDSELSNHEPREDDHCGKDSGDMTENKAGNHGGPREKQLDDLEEQLADSLGLEDDADEKSDKKKYQGSRDKEYRSDKRGKWLLAQRIRILRRQIVCRLDIGRLNASFLAIYESLIPAEEEKTKQKQLLTLLENLVRKEWPDARLYLYGSCANSFGFSKSDIDVCLTLDRENVDKSEILLRLAEILQADNLQNVQALTRARVPIVKLMDPVTGISCDICVNNVLAVVNTKLLRDYAQIDVRLRQLAFLVKHWAKSRGVNETYQGTLSSYAYVLMCIHFLQQRRPAILPCLQEMDATYSVSVNNVECAYFDQVERLYGFGSRNGETIAELLWAFFSYWAYYHDYANDVISVRRGCIVSKQGKDWTRRIGNDRHLICIEDPFEISHDLGRVVDRRSIRVIREEFERAAEVLQYDRDPCVKLFEPYIPD